MDITNFMTWFVSQVVRIFTFVFNTLNNITFGGTSLLKVIIFINIIVPFLYIIVTIPIGAGSIGADKVKTTSRKIKERNRIVRQSNMMKYLHPEWQTDKL